MSYFKQIKRNFLIRLMTVLGFGGMAAFCISSCQSTTSSSDKQPKSEVAEDAAVETSESNDAVNTPKPEFTEDMSDPNSGPAQDIQMPVKKYGIPAPLPPDVVEHFDEIQVPPTPEANEEALKDKNDEQSEELKPEYTEEDLMNQPEIRPVPEPIYHKMKYGVPHPAKRYGIQSPRS